MIVTLVHVHVKKEYVNRFITETEKNHKASLNEPGNVRFDILQDLSDPCKFILYEAYISDEVAAGHKKTPHYHTWRDSVEPYMAEQRYGVKYNILFPKDSDK